MERRVAAAGDRSYHAGSLNRTSPSVNSCCYGTSRTLTGGMDISLIARMKELEAENARLRKMYVEEKIKAEIVAEALAKKD